MHSPRNNKELGFTLIEVVLAILILGAALSVLIGMQSSVLSQTLRDRNEQQAMLFARRILSSLEVTEETIKVGEQQTSAKKMLEDFNLLNEDEDDLVRLDSLQATLQVSFSGIPNVDEEAMKRILLRVSWSPAPEDSFEVVYYIPNDEREIDEDAE